MKHLIPELEALKRRLPPDQDGVLVLPALRRIQEDRGYIADEDIDGLVEWLGIPRIRVEEILSFYHMLRRAPIGHWHLQVCRNVSCSMLGAERLIAHLEQRLGIAVGETTPDGRFTLSTVECLGACGGAPVVRVNEAYHDAVNTENVDALLDELAAAPPAETTGGRV
ncbi:MAG: NADH-quinone oxidoreductase subunit NuoE [Gammaproteobacteria bacterium]|nr:NADH-quinone oxidoreductase subunit NuoE [Gammaproteobacteria bacterium]